MKKMKYLKILLLIFWSFFLLFNNSQIIKADNDFTNTKSITNTDFEKALRTTPKGLNWDDDAFKIADFNKAYQHRVDTGTNLGNSGNPNIVGSNKTNNAKIIQSKNPETPGTSVIQMTNSTKQTGAVWSNMSKNNYFDVNHEQTASMWIYFGRVPDNNKQSGYQRIGDGMAFVLQNDANKENAIALSRNGIPVNGQSLGVWGADWNTSFNATSSDVSKTAIQNSWALEFDTFADINTNPTGEGNTFDYDLPYEVEHNNHIAANYPSLPSTYISYFNQKRYFTLDHLKHNEIKPIGNWTTDFGLVDSKWHHITVKWVPIKETVTGNLTYSYDDKDPDTGKKKETNYKSTFLIDTTKLGLTGKLGSPQTKDEKLYWGFTASTGNNSENNLLVFESIPSYVDVESTSSVYDYSQDPNGVQITDTNNKVDSNSEVKYKFALNYKGWTRTWDNIKASMKIPDHVKFTSGTITYPDSKTNSKPQPIASEAFTNIQNNNLQFQLPDSLTPDNRNAKIELSGRVDQTGTTSLKVPSVHADFEGNNLITGTDTQSFTINPRHLTLSSDMPNPITIAPEQDAVITGQASYDGRNPNYQNLIVHSILNGKDTAIDSNADSSGKFSFNIKNKELEKINNLDLYVTYNDNGQEFTSNHIYRQISIGGLLQINAPKAINFKNVYGTFGERIIPRLDDWNIDVTDSRKKGSEWKLTAKVAKVLTDDKGNVLNANIIYKDPTNVIHPLNEPYPIATNIKDSDEAQTRHITEEWTSSTGILLKLNNMVKTGTYKADILWTLNDTI